MTAKRVDNSGSEFSRETPRSTPLDTEFLRQETIDVSIPGDQDRIVPRAWKQRNLLSLDGGGIRGVWSLLALEKLMDCIESEERKSDGREIAEDSFHPKKFPKNVSLGPFLEDDLVRESGGDHKTWKASRRYLPCHYFDYICGSSTGALIAIMLGRLRMSVADCLHEYETLAGKVFGKPNFLNELRIPLINRTKYNCEVLRKVFADVVARHKEESDAEEPLMHSERRGLCRTCVIATRTKGGKGGTIKEEIIISSYDPMKSTWRADLLQAHSMGKGKDTTEFNQLHLSRHTSHNEPHTGETTNWPIWRVARAATAAPFYFDPVNSESQDFVYTDGGLKESNNPTKKGVGEIKLNHGQKSVGIVVSVGTARGETYTKLRIARKLKQLFGDASDPEQVHKWAKDKLTGPESSYYRMNNPGDLKLELDDWRPRGSFTKNGRSGFQTLSEIRERFYAWVGRSQRVTAVFQQCAEELVTHRRARACDQAQWEHYATGVQFDCLHCDYPTTFINRDAFNSHLQEKHTDENPLWGEDNAAKEWRYKGRRGTSSE
ncbi:FabD/lysophospholipase-like protein [Viridothelium virens]|uniref:FabD/lysophospholipase-like protein n=1 Tax=Viridothelium virens TaxID=1048519 RepID=A0A6A6HJA3_VIRVR|nr:FabD/lysophospholipase-like protein [Viridothelium virens]